MSYYDFPFPQLISILNPSLAEHDMLCLSKQCRSTSVKNPTDLDLHYLALSIYTLISCHTNMKKRHDHVLKKTTNGNMLKFLKNIFQYYHYFYTE